MERYNFKLAESKWQDFWDKEKIFKSVINKNKKISETFKTNLNKDFLSEFPDAKIFDVLEDGNE